MRIAHGLGVEGAHRATGTVVVVDVLRAFTVSAFALAGGARECVLVPTVEEARALAAAIPNAVISAEVDALPIPGIAISNSPTQIAAADLRGRTLVQRTSAGTPVINAVDPSLTVYAGSLVVARATARACLLTKADGVTLIASADFPEDHACVRYMEALMNGETPNVDELLGPLRRTDRYRKVASGEWPGFPSSDLELALTPDRFDFAMPASREGGHVVLRARR
jgi:2-phosphosulfolactate phosphatase